MVLRLGEDWTAESDLAGLAAAVDGAHRFLAAQLLLRRLAVNSFTGRRWHTAGRPLIEVIPLGLGPDSMPTRACHDASADYRLSPFATAAGRDGALLLTVPDGSLAIGCLDAEVAAFLVDAAREADLADLGRRLGVDAATAGRVLDELLTAGVLVAARGGPSRATAVWSPEEKALHHRARPAANTARTGGTYRFDGIFDAPPLAHTFTGVPTITLPAPPIPVDDPPLSTVIAARRSVREHHHDRAISLATLAEFLHRVQAVTPLGESHGQELGSRPYPCGGAICELEVYPIVWQCGDLEPGAYHYDSLGHRLERLAGDIPAVRRMLDYAAAAAMTGCRPQVLLVITSRVERLLWKYEGIGYSLTLKHTGVLTELMYLVATAMGLAPCALGAGDGAAFVEATGIDPTAEPAVAEFILGIPAPGGTS